MWPYWLMFAVPAGRALIGGPEDERREGWSWRLIGVVFALMMGLRHEVGGDWFSYLPHFEEISSLTFDEALEFGDPGYYLLNWLVARAGGDIYAVNLTCAIVLVLGTVTFCRRQPAPWLALTAAVPYLLIVVGMGYTRQAAALGFALLGLAALGEGRVRAFAFWIAVGATFHKSAVLLLPIAALAARRSRAWTATWVGVVTALLYYLLLEKSTDTLWENYVEAEYQSQGGMIRVMMNVVPATILLFFRERLVPDERERRLWTWMSVLALVCVPLVSLASTAVDRVALYLIPIQLFAFGRLPNLSKSDDLRGSLATGVVGFYGVVLFVWLNYAAHAEFWLPYQFMPFG